MDQMQLDLGDTEAENKRQKVEEAKAKVRELAEQHRAEKAAERKPNKDFGHTRVGGVGGSGSGDFGSGIQKMNKDIKRNYKSGGKVSSASKRADGCCIRGKTRA